MNNINTFSNDATRQIAETVRTVQATPSNPRQGNKGTQRIYKARLTATINDPAPPNDPIIYQFEAEQVYFDGSAWTAVPNGVTWDSDVILYVFDSGVVGDIVTAEPLSNGANSTIWTALKPAGGGGDTKVWAKITSGSLKSYLGDIYDDPIETNPALFTGANVYAHNVDFGSVNVGAILPTDLIGSTYYVYPATFGG
jgi:hypothetical protein